MLNRLVTGNYDYNYTMTVGLDYFSKEIEVSEGKFVRKKNKISIIMNNFFF